MGLLSPVRPSAPHGAHNALVLFARDLDISDGLQLRDPRAAGADSVSRWL